MQEVHVQVSATCFLKAEHIMCYEYPCMRVRSITFTAIPRRQIFWHQPSLR